jgi:G:T-mismatch repair DNA endonuclease (very short patch repair protein)
MDHTVCRKMILDFCERNVLGLGDVFQDHYMLWFFVSGSYWNMHDSSPVKMQSKKLVLSRWGLGVMWVCLGRTMRRSSSPVSLLGGFGASSPYLCLIHRHHCESQSTVSYHHRTDIWDSLQFERLREARFLDHPEDPHTHP